MTLVVLDSFLAGTGRTHQVIWNMSCPRLGTDQLSGKPWSLLVTNNIARPQSRIHTDISNSNSERFFPPNLLLLCYICISLLLYQKSWPQGHRAYRITVPHNSPLLSPICTHSGLRIPILMQRYQYNY